MNTIKPYGSPEQTIPNPLVRRADVSSTLAMRHARGEHMSPAYKGPEGSDMVRCGDTAVRKGLIIDIWV